MAEPIPIKSGIEPEFDTERELLDFVMTQIRRFSKDMAAVPESIAIVLLGKNDSGNLCTHVNSWSPTESRSRFETCSMAATLLTDRAVKSD